MKKVLYLAVVLALTVCASLLLFSCKDGGETPPEPPKNYTVMVSPATGVDVLGDNPKEVEAGGSVMFSLNFWQGYVYKSSEGAEYDPVKKILTVDNVTEDVNIDLITESVDFDVTNTFYYIFRSDFAEDTSSVPSLAEITAGTRVKLSAKDTSRIFLGWSVGFKLSSGGTLVSSDRDSEIMLTPDMESGGTVVLVANYSSNNTIYYDANGGAINRESVNISSRDYYTATVTSEKLTVVMGGKYLAYFECASSFYDDGSFSRDGYVLKEYNTKPDGTGTSYSLGSKVPFISDGTVTTLYCIWSEDTAHSAFTYEDITVLRPEDVPEDYAPNWNEEGIVITGYNGNDETVTVPEKIDGKAVISIAGGAFVNKNIKTLVLPKTLLTVDDGAFVGCSKIETVYYPDCIYSMNDGAFDSASYTSFKNFYVNATIAPRFGSADIGALSVKLSRLLAPVDKNRIIVISGSSSLQGLGSEYLEALLDGKYRVVNFGTTRTTHGALYLEAMGTLAKEGDIVIYAPENSSYMWGERELYWKTFRDLEGMNNIYRLVDFSGYSGMFSAMSELNATKRYNSAPISYESICAHGELLSSEPTYKASTTNKYGDYLYNKRDAIAAKYHDVYFVTMSNRVKSRFEGEIYDYDNQKANKNYNDPNNVTWCSTDDPYYRDTLNRAIAKAKSSGAKVYFGFCPADASKLVEEATSLAYLEGYDLYIDETFDFDGRIGSAFNYVFNHRYFYDCAFHPNDYGRTYRTYQLYLDISATLGVKAEKNVLDVGTDFAGCLFEEKAWRGPVTAWDMQQ